MSFKTGNVSFNDLDNCGPITCPPIANLATSNLSQEVVVLYLKYLDLQKCKH
jgi:hypothetical protein